MIDAVGLSKRYHDHVAIDDVTFQVQRGEVVGFLGLNGAGKTTTLRILTGSLPAQAGRATIAGFDVSEHPREVARRIGYLPEVAPVYRDLSVRESLRFVARLKSVERSKITAECERVMQQVGLLDVADRLLRNLSKGYQQRCGLAQALISEPEVLILDEPTVGLDPRQIGEVRNLIRGLAGSHTVFLSTHMLTEVAAVCERAVIIHRGRIVADDRLDNLAHAEDAGSLEQAFLRLTGD